MEGEHSPTIIQLIRSTDLAVIQFKDSHIFFIFPISLAWPEVRNPGQAQNSKKKYRSTKVANPVRPSIG